MNNQTKDRIKKLTDAYNEFEKRLDELKTEQNAIVREAIKAIEQTQIKETRKKIDKIKD